MPLTPSADKHSEAAGIPIPLPTATSQRSGLRVTLTDRYDLNPETSKRGQEITGTYLHGDRPPARGRLQTIQLPALPQTHGVRPALATLQPDLLEKLRQKGRVFVATQRPGTARELCTEGNETHVPDSRGVTPTTWRWSEDGTERPVRSQTHTQARRCPTKATPQVGLCRLAGHVHKTHLSKRKPTPRPTTLTHAKSRRKILVTLDLANT